MGNFPPLGIRRDGLEFNLPNWFWEHWPRVGRGADLFMLHNVWFHFNGNSSWHAERDYPTFHTKRHLVLKAVCDNNLYALEKYIQNGWNIHDTVDPERGYDAVGIAAQLDRLEALHLMYKLGADLNTPSGKYQNTPLMIAVSNWQMRIIEFLLENKVDINKKDSFGFTAKDKAEFRGLYNIYSLLDDYEKNPNEISSTHKKIKKESIVEKRQIKNFGEKLKWKPSMHSCYGYYPFIDFDRSNFVATFFGNFEYFNSNDIRLVV